MSPSPVSMWCKAHFRRHTRAPSGDILNRSWSPGTTLNRTRPAPPLRPSANPRRLQAAIVSERGGRSERWGAGVGTTAPTCRSAAKSASDGNRPASPGSRAWGRRRPTPNRAVSASGSYYGFSVSGSAADKHDPVRRRYNRILT